MRTLAGDWPEQLFRSGLSLALAEEEASKRPFQSSLPLATVGQATGSLQPMLPSLQRRRARTERSSCVATLRRVACRSIRSVLACVLLDTSAASRNGRGL